MLNDNSYKNSFCGKPPKAWHKKGKLMFEVFELVWLDGKLHEIWCARPNWPEERKFNPKEVVLLMPTGLPDKKGVEIYEEDVLKISGYGYEDIHIAKFDEKKNTYILSECGGDNELYRAIKSTLREVEIIGDSFQRPDLLGKLE